MKNIGKIGKLICLVLLVALSQMAFAQDEIPLVKVYDNFDKMIFDHPDANLTGSLDTKYFKGSVKFSFEDGSYVTPSGVLIKIYKLWENGNQKSINKVITDVKGVFYIDYLPLGYIKLDLISSKEVVCTRYFFLDENSSNNLEPILVPIDKIERKDEQESKYKDF